MRQGSVQAHFGVRSPRSRSWNLIRLFIHTQGHSRLLPHCYGMSLCFVYITLSVSMLCTAKLITFNFIVNKNVCLCFLLEQPTCNRRTVSRGRKKPHSLQSLRFTRLWYFISFNLSPSSWLSATSSAFNLCLFGQNVYVFQTVNLIFLFTVLQSLKLEHLYCVKWILENTSASNFIKPGFFCLLFFPFFMYYSCKVSKQSTLIKKQVVLTSLKNFIYKIPFMLYRNVKQ